MLAITQGVYFVGRDIFEGVPYQVAYSAAIGDAGLIVAILIAVSAFHRESHNIYSYALSLKKQLVVVFVSTFAGIIFAVYKIVYVKKTNQWVDAYHDIFIVPVYIFMWIILVPIVKNNGTMNEKISIILFVCVWGILVTVDVLENRLNQRLWLKLHGVILVK